MKDRSQAAPAHKPGTAAGTKAFVVTPFTRLAHTHAASTAADAMVTAALAGSLFFSVPAGDARGPVLRYLVITMLPFAVLSPLIGPAIDRLKGGHRFMVIASGLARAVTCYFMISKIGPASEKHAKAGDVAAFFLLALCILVFGKAYQVARSALVPTVVGSDEELVKANSKLSIISAISGIVGVLPAAGLLKLFGPQWAVGLAMLTYGAATVLATKVPGARIATESADATERHELRGAGIIMAGSAMGLIRAAVGFMFFLIAFDFRGGDRPTWQFGFVGAVSVGSQMLGSVVAPRLRSLTTEENILTGVLCGMIAGGFFALILGDVGGAAVLGGAVGFAASAGKLAFDSILQRDAPDANRGRAFARFETRFQVTWVIGALVPVAIHMTAHIGFALVFLLSMVAAGSYVVARLAQSHRLGHRQNAATAAAVEIEKRFDEVSEEFKGRLASGSRTLFRRLRGRNADEAELDLRADEFDDAGRGPGDGSVGGAASVAQPPGGAGRSGPGVGGSGTAAAGTVVGTSTVAGDAPTVFDDELATTSPIAWLADDQPEPDDLPWEPPAEPAPRPGEFLEDVDPSVANPYPWTPDDATRADGADDPTRIVDPTNPDAPAPGNGRGEAPRRRHTRPGSPVRSNRRKRH